MSRGPSRRLGCAVVALAVLLCAGRARAARPAGTTTLPSAQGNPFLVHGGAADSALMLRIRDAADRAWRAEITDAGWPAPPVDNGGPDGRFDIYVDHTLGAGEAYVLPEDDVAATPWQDQTSYMGLPVSFANDAELFSTVAHELNHASQFALDATESDPFFEHTAVFVEQRVANDFPTYGIGIADYQAHPERALDYIGTDDYEYGAALWLMFLSEQLGDGGHALVQRLWRDGKQVGTVNRPSWLDALDGILGDHGWTRARFFASFSAARYFTGPRDDGHHFLAGAAWGASSLIATEPHPLASAPLMLRASVAAMGTHLFALDLTPPPAALDIQLGGPEPALAVVALDAVGLALGAPQVVVGTAPARLGLPAGAARLIVALTYVPAAYDPNGSDRTARALTVMVTPAAQAPDGGSGAPDGSPDGTLGDASRGDAGTDASAGDAGHAPDSGAGCGCRTSGRPGGGGALVLVLAVALAITSRGRCWPRRRCRRCP